MIRKVSGLSSTVKKLQNNAFYCLVIPTNAKTTLLIPCTVFCGGKDLFPTAKLTLSHFSLQTIRVSIFYGLELVFKVSFRVRTRFRIRINNVMSVWQLATTVAAILVVPIRHSSGHFCS